MDKAAAEQFESAFDMHISCPVATCECGRTFFDAHNTVYDWEPGELDRLQSNKSATACPYGIQQIYLEGSVYCMDCDCWHKRAEHITDWLRSHADQIKEWFRLESLRLQAEAKRFEITQ